MINKILGGITIVAILIVTLVGCNNMKFDQTTNKNDLLTEKYSIDHIDELKRTAEGGNMTFAKFKRDFNVQCVRKTHQGYYVVLLLEDDRNAFCFFDKKDRFIQVIVSNGFKTKNEFQNQVKEQMLKSEVLNFDTNTFFVPISALDVTTHIVQEGICIVKYSRYKDGKLTGDPIVTSIEFVENESIATLEDPFISYEMPFVLEIDKVSE